MNKLLRNTVLSSSVKSPGKSGSSQSGSLTPLPWDPAHHTLTVNSKSEARGENGNMVMERMMRARITESTVQTAPTADNLQNAEVYIQIIQLDNWSMDLLTDF